MRKLMALAAAFTLISCGGGDEKTATSNVQATPVTDAIAQVASLSELQRNGVFLRAIRDSGIACQEVSGSERIKLGNGVMGWRAKCENGNAHLIEILNDGTAKVTSRVD